MNNLKNLAQKVLKDESVGYVKYYFAGKKYPFVQLGINCDNRISGDEDYPIRELVGLFGDRHKWQSTDKAEILLLNKFSYNTTKIMTPIMIDNDEVKAFLPSKEEYEINPVVAGKVYNACGGYVWSRSRYGDNNAWFMGNSNGDLFSDYTSDSYYYAPAFNLDLSKIFMVRDAVSGRAIMDYSDDFHPYEGIKNSINNEVKFLAQVDDTVVHVEKKTDGTLVCHTKLDNIAYSYLSAIIVDKDDNILYYNLLGSFNRFTNDNGKKYDESIQCIKLPENLPEGCRLGLFTETRNAEYYMDTCGKITWLDIKDGQIGRFIHNANDKCPVLNTEWENSLLNIYNKVMRESVRNAGKMYVLDRENKYIEYVRIKDIRFFPAGNCLSESNGFVYYWKDKENDAAITITAYKKTFFFNKDEAENALAELKKKELTTACVNFIKQSEASIPDIIEVLKEALEKLEHPSIE